MNLLTSYITPEITVYIILGLFLLIIILLIWNIKLEIKTKKLMRGKNGASLESAFLEMQKDLNDFEKFRQDLEKYLAHVEKRLKNSIQGLHNHNFNAFTGLESGGKSFATAFLNQHGNGIILSSLHARDRVSIFAKQIKNFKPEIDLSEEETLALTKARESCNL